MTASTPHRVAGISKRRAWVLAVVGLLAVVVVLAGVKAGQIGTMIKAGKAFTIPPEAVTAAKVETAEWQASRGAPATLVAVRAVTVASEIAGTVRELGFDSGAYVRRGDLMVKLDTSTEEAQLASAQADAELARANLHRARSLRAAQTNSPADLDAADARAKSANAAVATLQANIAKKTIRAPFDGRVSIRQIELGQVLASGTAITSLVSITPIHADFFLPQQALADLRPGMQTRLHTDVFPDAAWDGVVSTINSEVDVSTRNVRVRATFPNGDARLRPGMFASVEVLSPDKRKVLVIPSTGVLYAPYGDSVFTVEEKEGGQGSLVARQKFVRLGEHRGDLVTVTSGLNAGETVVTSGAFKLRNGSAVMVRNDLGPGAEIAPKPTDR